MKQFILGKKVAYATGATLDLVPDGAIGFFYNKDGKPTVTTTGEEIKDMCILVLGRSANKGGPISIPIYKNNFSYSKGTYEAATTYSGDFTITEVSPGLTYTVIVVKKGMKFNERNKWTATVRAGSNDTKDTIAAKLAELINNNGENSGVSAVDASGKVTVTGLIKGVDYELVLADELYGLAVNQTHAVTAYGDAKYVQDLANKAAADAGFEYTYLDDGRLMYPNYPLNPLKVNDSEDTGFIIYSMRFSEPRKVGTKDELVNQIVQIAVPTGTTVTEIDAILAKLAE